MRTIFLFLLLTSLTVVPSAPQRVSSSRQSTAKADVTKYIGLRHGPSLPDGLTLIGGALVSEVGEAKVYTLSKVHEGKVKMLWFGGSTHRNEAGVVYSEVKDVLVLPLVPRKQVLVYSFCFLENRPDKEIVAIVDYQPREEYFTRVRRAWRANRQTEKFEVIPTKGIKCENQGFGV